MNVHQVEAALAAATMVATGALAGGTTITSADGSWRADIDAFGQVIDFYADGTPQIDSVFETLLYDIGIHNDEVTRRVDSTYTVLNQVFASDSSITRLTRSTSPLQIDIANQMISGPNGGVLVTIRATNTGTEDIEVKLIYYCDFDIPENSTDDEGYKIEDDELQLVVLGHFNHPGSGSPPRPLWLSSCVAYESWQIDTFPVLRNLLDVGASQLEGLDGTNPQAADGQDHTCAISSGAEVIGPGQFAELKLAIGPPFTACTACPWDCEALPDGIVSTSDLLALLTQWGGIGPCDADGGGTSTSDLLELLANWGACP